MLVPGAHGVVMLWVPGGLRDDGGLPGQAVVVTAMTAGDMRCAGTPTPRAASGSPSPPRCCRGCRGGRQPGGAARGTVPPPPPPPHACSPPLPRRAEPSRAGRDRTGPDGTGRDDPPQVPAAPRRTWRDRAGRCRHPPGTGTPGRGGRWGGLQPRDGRRGRVILPWPGLPRGRLCPGLGRGSGTGPCTRVSVRAGVPVAMCWRVHARACAHACAGARSSFARHRYRARRHSPAGSGCCRGRSGCGAAQPSGDRGAAWEPTLGAGTIASGLCPAGECR